MLKLRRMKTLKNPSPSTAISTITLLRGATFIRQEIDTQRRSAASAEGWAVGA
jgi:hypothetical protein